MPDTKISGLLAATAALATDQYAINQGGVSKSIAFSVLSGGASSDPYDVSTTTVGNEEFLLQYQHLKISSTGRLTMAGTGEIYASDLGAYDASPIVGSPKYGSFTLPDAYSWDLLYELRLFGTSRATLQGQRSDLILTDDFASRQRIILAG